MCVYVRKFFLRASKSLCACFWDFRPEDSFLTSDFSFLSPRSFVIFYSRVRQLCKGVFLRDEFLGFWETFPIRRGVSATLDFLACSLSCVSGRPSQ